MISNMWYICLSFRLRLPFFSSSKPPFWYAIRHVLHYIYHCSEKFDTEWGKSDSCWWIGRPALLASGLFEITTPCWRGLVTDRASDVTFNRITFTSRPRLRVCKEGGSFLRWSTLLQGRVIGSSVLDALGVAFASCLFQVVAFHLVFCFITAVCCVLFIFFLLASMLILLYRHNTWARQVLACWYASLPCLPLTHSRVFNKARKQR